MPIDDDTRLIMATAESLVSAYAAYNAVQSLPELFRNTFEEVRNLVLPKTSTEEPAALTFIPAVPIEQSIADDHLVSLITGEKFQSLKRHLTAQGVTAEEYRARYGLAQSYPLVCPAYSRERSALAKKMGLGQHRKRQLAAAKAAAQVAPKRPARKPAAKAAA